MVRPFEGLREFLGYLEERKDLIKILEPLDSRFEISAVLNESSRKETPAVIFEKVKGYKIPVVSNILGSRERLKWALGIDQGKLTEEIPQKMATPLKTMPVEDAPVKEVVIRKDIDILKLFPVLTHYEKDGGPYITAGVASIKHPEGKINGRGLHRVQVKGKDKLGILLLNPPLSEFLKIAKKKNVELEVAIAIGLDPVTLFSSVLGGLQIDKFEMAGALRGQPLKVTKCETVDLEVPAHAEIVIEGTINPNVVEDEGPLGEATGYYNSFKSPVIQVRAVTCREKPLYQAILPFALEVDLLASLQREIQLLSYLKSITPWVEKVRSVPKTLGSSMVITVSTDERGEIRRILSATLSMHFVKKAVAVNADVDDGDLTEVEWALFSRFQADRDLILITETKGLGIDPSAKGGLSSKIGVDATKPSLSKEFEKIGIPESAKEKAKRLCHTYGIGR